MSKAFDRLRDGLEVSAPLPPLRRGKGVQLSTEKPSDAITQDRDVARSHNRTDAKTHEGASAESHVRTNAETHFRDNAISREIPSGALVQDRISAITHDRTDAIVRESGTRRGRGAAPDAEAVPARVNRGYKLREDLIDQTKHLAIKQKRNLYELMEDALTEYLARHGG